MSATPPTDSPVRVRDFTSADIVKLVSATFLPLCDALATAGLVTKGELAQTLRNSVPSDETEAWGALVLALALTLEEADKRGQDGAAEMPGPPFTIIEGGRP